MDLFNFAGVRGVALAELPPWLGAEIGAAAVAEFDAETIAVGRDTRTTSPLLADAVTAGMKAAGVSVRDVGVLPTPGLQCYCDDRDLPGLMITASHNPPEFNGIKFLTPAGSVATPETVGAIEQRVENGALPTADWDAVGDHGQDDRAGHDTYVTDVLRAVDAEAIARADLHVVVDPGHGTGTATNVDLFAAPELGLRVETVFDDPDGRFPGRHSEPVAENLGVLKTRVAESDADLGVAFDGDADRAAFVDEHGEFVRGDSVFAALVREYCGDGDSVVSSIDASQRVVDAAHERGASVELTKMGATYLVERTRELWDAGQSVPIAGEGTGGIMFPERRPCRDGAHTAARFLETVATHDERSVASVVAPWEGYHKERVDLSYDSREELDTMMERAETWAQGRAEAVRSIEDGGVRADLDGAWALARPSGTEPLLRVYAEATDPSRAAALVANFADSIREEPA